MGRFSHFEFKKAFTKGGQQNGVLYELQQVRMT